MKIDRSQFTLEERWDLADFLARETLSEANRNSKLAKPRKSIYSKYIKRVLDVGIASIGIVFTIPINVAIGIITMFDVGRPLFFQQTRIGFEGKPFQIVKFRNMRNTRDERGELLPASERVTKFGKFVRKTSLDELLNIFYVFKGDMSIIGPRPLLEEYVSRYSERHRTRLSVKPGLECPPRRKGGSVRTWQDQFENDVWYVENVSFITDVMMCIRLVQYALDRKNAEARSSVSDKGIFMGYNREGRAINLDEIPQDIVEKWYIQRLKTRWNDG